MQLLNEHHDAQRSPHVFDQSVLSKLAARRWPILGALLFAVIVIYLATPRLLGPNIAAYRVTTQDLVQTVVASGSVQTPYRVSIGSQITGTVASVPVKEGQVVKAGDILIVLDDHEAKATLVQAEGAVAQAEAKLRQIREVGLPSAQQSLKQTQATLLNAQAIHDRTAKLNKDGYATKAALDDATKSLDVARTQVHTAEFQVHTNSPGGSDYVLAGTQIEQAKANLLMAKAKLEYTTIEAPWDGTLIARNVERGNVVQPSQILMTLSPAGETELVVQIDEKNLSLLRIGQKALSSADAYSGQTFAAELAYINPSVDAARGSVQVKLKVPNPPDYLRQDMTVSVEIEVSRRLGALAIAADAIRDVTSPHPWVLKVNSSRARRQPVKIGVRGDLGVEVTEGLAAGDLVIPATNKAISEGQKVRATAR